MTFSRSDGLRFFVGGSLVFGALLLLVEARVFRDLPEGWAGIVVAAGAWSGALALLLALARRGSWNWRIPSAGFLLSLLLPVAWSHFDPTGHYVLGLLAPAVALGTGVGVVRGKRWAWPPGFAIAAGIGPLFLVIVPLPDAAYAAAFTLFVADALALLALTREFLGGETTPA